MEEEKITITLSKAMWEEYSHSLSDVLCWARGFQAAQPEDRNIGLYGISELCHLNSKIKDALRCSS